MKHEPGFYWIALGNEVLVAQYVHEEYGEWWLPGPDFVEQPFVRDSEVKVLSEKLTPPKS